MSEKEGQEGRELHTWKEIGAYLNVTERTARKWAEHGMPIHQMPGGGGRGRVVAYTQELDRWKKDRKFGRPKPEPEPAAPRSRSKWIGAGLLVVCLTLSISAYMFWSRDRGGVARITAHGKDLILHDLAGKEMWRFTFPNRLLPGAYTPGLNLHELYPLDPEHGGGYLFNYQPIERASIGSALYRFSPRGKPLWNFVPGSKLRTRGREFTHTFFVSRFLPFRDGGRSLVALTSNHSAGYPNQLAILDDASGSVVGEYWHSGHLPHIAAADLDRDGRDELIMEGVNDGHGLATLLVFDPANVRGASAQPPGDHRQILGFPPGSEKAIVFFPKSCMSKADAFNRAFDLEVGKEFIRVFVAEGVIVSRSQYLIYELDFDLNAISVLSSSSFRTLHQEMESAGKLDHSYSEEEMEALKRIDVRRKNW